MAKLNYEGLVSNKLYHVIEYAEKKGVSVDEMVKMFQMSIDIIYKSDYQKTHDKMNIGRLHYMYDGCKKCKHAPTTYEEYCISKSSPHKYCPDAYTDKSYLCGNYNADSKDRRENKL